MKKIALFFALALLGCTFCGEVFGQDTLQANPDTEFGKIMSLRSELEEKYGEKIFLFGMENADENPTFKKGGLDRFAVWLNNKSMNRESVNTGDGLLFAFVVNKSGRVRDVTLITGGQQRANEKVEKMIRQSPRWKPGRHKGREVNVLVIYSVRIVNGGEYEGY